MPLQKLGPTFRKDLWFKETDYVPHPGQELVHYDPSRHRVLSNGRRWGKSIFGGKEIETFAFVKNYLQQPMRGWIVGPNYDDAEKEFRIVYNTFKRLGIDTLSKKFLNNSENGNMRISTNWGFDLECKSAQKPESLVGEGLDFVLMAEAGRHRRFTFTEYIRPALSDKRGLSMMSGVPEDANESNLLYWAYLRGKDPSFPTWKSWQLPSWTNSFVFPGGRNDPEILEAEGDLTEDEFNRQYGGQFVLKRGRVMKEWEDNIHVKELTYNPDWPLYAAVDYGYTNDWVWLWIQVNPVDKRVYVIKEQRYRMRDTDDITRNEISRDPLLSRLLVVYPDPSSPDDSSILKRNLKVSVGTNTGGTINSRLRLIRQALKSKPDYLPVDHPQKLPGLIIDKSCTKLIWEMREGYRWPEGGGNAKNASEIPQDVDNHGPEALGRFFKGHMESITGASKSRQSTVSGMRRRSG